MEMNSLIAAEMICNGLEASEDELRDIVKIVDGHLLLRAEQYLLFHSSYPRSLSKIPRWELLLTDSEIKSGKPEASFLTMDPTLLQFIKCLRRHYCALIGRLQRKLDNY